MASIEEAFAADPLGELDQDEWWDICRRAAPGLTREQFDEMWADFQARKADGRLKPAH